MDSSLFDLLKAGVSVGLYLGGNVCSSPRKQPLKTVHITMVVFLSTSVLSASANCQTAGKAALKEARRQPEIPKSEYHLIS